MRFALIILASFLSTAAPSQDDQVLGAGLEWLNEINTENNISLCHPSTDASQDAELCANAICGDPQKKPNMGQYKSPEVMPLTPETRLRLKKVLEITVRRNNEIIKHLRQLNNRNQFSIDFSKMSPESLNEIVGKVVHTYLVVAPVDFSKPFNERMKISFNFPRGTPKELQDYMKYIANRTIAASKENFGSTDFLGLYSDDELRSIWKRDFEEVSPKIKSLANPELARLIQEQFPLAANQPSNRDELLGQIRTIRNVSYSIDNKMLTYLPTTPIDLCKTSICWKAITAYFTQTKKIESMLNEIEKTNNDPAFLQTIFEECASAFQLADYHERAAQTMKTTLPGIIDTFIKNAMADSSSHSKESFLSFVGKINFDIGNALPAKTRLDQFEKKLSTPPAISDHWGELSKFYDESNTLNMRAPFTICDSSEFVRKDSYEGREASSNRFKSTRTISISNFSCTYHQYGQPIVAHELGHALSHAHSQNILSSHSKVNFLSARQCIEANNPSVRSPAVWIRHEEDRYYTEEDQADLMSSRTYPGSTYHCGMLRTTLKDNKLVYTNLEASVPLTGSLFDNPHSTPFTRVLRQQINAKKSLPDPCVKFIKANLHAGYARCE